MFYLTSPSAGGGGRERQTSRPETQGRYTADGWGEGMHGAVKAGETSPSSSVYLPVPTGQSPLPRCLPGRRRRRRRSRQDGRMSADRKRTRYGTIALEGTLDDAAALRAQSVTAAGRQSPASQTDICVSASRTTVDVDACGRCGRCGRADAAMCIAGWRWRGTMYIGAMLWVWVYTTVCVCVCVRASQAVVSCLSRRTNIVE